MSATEFRGPVDHKLLISVLMATDLTPSLQFDYGKNGLLEGAVELAKILLFGTEMKGIVYYTSRHESRFDRWYDAQPKKVQHRITVWIFSLSRNRDWYFFEKFEERPEIQEIFDLLISQPVPPPYLELLMLNIIKQLFGLSNDDMAEISLKTDRLYVWYDRLLDNKTRVMEWIVANRDSLRFLGGSTNTFLNFYDHYFNGLDFRKDAEVCYDIGGGFSTSEINRLTAREFTSLDLLSPLFTDYDPRMIIRKARENERSRCLNEREMQRYLKCQAMVPWQAFDVGTDSIPKDYSSYLLTSTGFMTSTVRPSAGMVQQWCSEKLPSGKRTVLTSLIAMYRVIELVAAGKHVTLFSINRASSRYYSHAAVVLEWKDGKIVDFRSTPKKKPMIDFRAPEA